MEWHLSGALRGRPGQAIAAHDGQMTHESNGPGDGRDGHTDEHTEADGPPRASAAGAPATRAADEAFAAAARAHLAGMLRLAAGMVGPADAEDVTQEAITRAWRAWATLREPATAKAWLLRITMNVCQDWVRGRFGTHRARTVPLSDDADEGFALLGADPGASDAATAMDLRHAVSTLDADMRVVVVLRYYAGMDATEIGGALGIPSATVRTRLRRALLRLRDQLSNSPRLRRGANDEEAH